MKYPNSAYSGHFGEIPNFFFVPLNGQFFQIETIIFMMNSALFEINAWYMMLVLFRIN